MNWHVDGLVYVINYNDTSDVWLENPFDDTDVVELFTLRWEEQQEIYKMVEESIAANNTRGEGAYETA